MRWPHPFRSLRKRHEELLLALLAAKPSGRFGADMWKLSGVPSGAMYVALASLERKGLAVSEWIDGPYPRRRLYRATSDGRIAAAKAGQPAAEVPIPKPEGTPS